MYFTVGMLYVNTICLLVLPTILGRLYPCRASRTNVPVTSLGNEIIPKTAAIFVFNSAKEAAPLIPCDHQTPIFKLQLQRFPNNLSKPSWRPPHWVWGRGVPHPLHISPCPSGSPQHISSQISPLHNFTFFPPIFNVNERSKSIWARIRLDSIVAFCIFIQHLSLVCCICSSCWISPIQI